MRLTTVIAVSLVLLSGCAQQKSMSKAPMTLQGHLDMIMDMWPGTYHNGEQITAVEKEGGDVWRVDDSGEGGYLDLTSHYIKLDRPDIGDHVLYVEEYRDGQPDQTYRQRIYTLSVDDKSQIVRVKMYPFKDKEKYIGSWKDLSMLDELSIEGITAFPAICDMLVKPMDGKYYMYMNESDCTFGSKTFNYEVMLSKDLFSYRDKITDSEKNEVTSAANFSYHHLKRKK